MTTPFKDKVLADQPTFFLPTEEASGTVLVDAAETVEELEAIQW